jgi:general secretion pathway protein G
MVVLAVVLLLAALSLAALSGAKTRAATSTCLNNLRQWGYATQLYALDHDDFLPAEGSPNGQSTTTGWYNLLPRSLGIPTYAESAWRTNRAAPLPRAIWFCPANTNRSNGHNLFHYCLNEHIDGTGSLDRPLRLSNVNRPSAAVWLFDNGKRAAVAQQNNLHTNLHFGGAQLLFLDGHARRFRSTEYWDFASDKGRTDNPEIVWTP